MHCLQELHCSLIMPMFLMAAITAYLVPFGLTAICLTLVGGLTPRQTDIINGELRIRSWFRTYRYPLATVSAAEKVDPASLSWRSTVRLCGVEWRNGLWEVSVISGIGRLGFFSRWLISRDRCFC